jgi:hypothetical protein
MRTRRCSALSIIGGATAPTAQLPDLPPFAISPLDPVEELFRLFGREHHADIAGGNPSCTLGVKFMALDKRHAFVEAIIRNTNAGPDQDLPQGTVALS